jgi:hypothetical protein
MKRAARWPHAGLERAKSGLTVLEQRVTTLRGKAASRHRGMVRAGIVKERSFANGRSETSSASVEGGGERTRGRASDYCGRPVPHRFSLFFEATVNYASAQVSQFDGLGAPCMSDNYPSPTFDR